MIKFQDIKCKLGFHKWKYSKPFTIYDVSPNPFDSKYDLPKRICEHCKYEQEWLPGYGGNEIGCWLTIKKL